MHTNIHTHIHTYLYSYARVNVNDYFATKDLPQPRSNFYQEFLQPTFYKKKTRKCQDNDAAVSIWPALSIQLQFQQSSEFRLPGKLYQINCLHMYILVINCYPILHAKDQLMLFPIHPMYSYHWQKSHHKSMQHLLRDNTIFLTFLNYHLEKRFSFMQFLCKQKTFLFFSPRFYPHHLGWV